VVAKVSEEALDVRAEEAVIVTVAEADSVVSATLVAVTVTGLVLGIALGAV
jgi:hypothetical protein